MSPMNPPPPINLKKSSTLVALNLERLLKLFN